VSSRLRPGLHVSTTRMAYEKSSSGAVVSTVRTASSSPVLSRSSVASASMRLTVATSSAPAVSVTNPRGVGTTGSAATPALAVRARSASAARLRMDRVYRGHDALGVGQIARELLARLTEARRPAPRRISSARRKAGSGPITRSPAASTSS